ncbi:PIN domain-containing protein [Methylovulum sp.]|uniref:PIN domain-containing protein n=1 Tax=Methylovulum sp. TaxID=1916980 RepID=UPI003424988F
MDADKDDNKFVDCAVAGNADFLVSNDRHFNVLKTIEFPKLQVFTIFEFIERL